MSGDSTRKYGPYAALLSAVVFWGLSFIGTKIALQSFPVLIILFLRFSIATVFFVALMYYKKMHRISLEQHKKVLFLALAQPILYFIFESYGIKNTGAATSSLLIATVPIVVMILAVLFLKEKVTLPKLLGIILSFVGILLIVYGDPRMSSGGNNSLWGLFCLSMAVLFGAIYNVLARSISQGLSVIAMTGYQFLYGTLILIPMLLVQQPVVDLPNIPLEGILAVIFLTLFSTIVGFLSYNYALSKIPASQASVFLNAIPVVTVLGAWVYLQETITLLQLIAGAIIILALYLANKPEGRKGETAEVPV